jgi:nucleoside-diphosphate-sugar epimerase
MMQVEGNGMIARAFREIGDPHSPCVIFARGVGNSQTQDESEYDRERALLLSALRQASRQTIPLVYFSGSPIYGDFSERVCETTPCRPKTRYGRHQVDCEEIIRQSRAPYLIARLPNVVGSPGNPQQLVASLVRQTLSGQVTIQSLATRDLIDVDDVVRLVLRLVEIGVIDETINIASGYSTPAAKIAESVAQLLGEAPNFVEVEGGDMQRFDVSRLASVIGPLPFGDTYPSKTLTRYASAIAASIEIPLARNPHRG